MYYLRLISLPIQSYKQTVENSSVWYLQISIDYPLTLLLPIHTIKKCHLSLLLNLLQVSLSVSYFQLTFYHFQTLPALLLICTSFSSFLLLTPARAFFIFISFSLLSGTIFRILPSCILTTYSLFMQCYYSFLVNTFICNYSHTIHSWRHSFIHFPYQIVVFTMCQKLCFTLETQQ